MSNQLLTPESDSVSSPEIIPDSGSVSPLELIPELEGGEGSIGTPDSFDTWIDLLSSSPPSIREIEASSPELPGLSDDSDEVPEGNLKRGRSSSDRSATGSSVARSSPEKKKLRCEDELDTPEQDADDETKSEEAVAAEQDDKASNDEVAEGEPEEESSAGEAEQEAK